MTSVRRASKKRQKTVNPPGASHDRGTEQSVAISGAKRAGPRGTGPFSAGSGKIAAECALAARWTLPQRYRCYAAIFVRLNGPTTANGSQGGHSRKGLGHPGEHRQAAAGKRPIRPSEHEESQDRQNAGADDSQNAAEIGQHKEDHGRERPAVTLRRV